MREYRRKNPEIMKAIDLKKYYGLSKAEYDEMLAMQNYVCAICEQPETMLIKGKLVALAVDHCHDTNAVRGLLCNACNRAIGLLKNDTELLEKAIRYLKAP